MWNAAYAESFHFLLVLQGAVIIFPKAPLASLPMSPYNALAFQSSPLSIKTGVRSYVMSIYSSSSSLISRLISQRVHDTVVCLSHALASSDSHIGKYRFLQGLTWLSGSLDDHLPAPSCATLSILCSAFTHFLMFIETS